MSEEIVREFPIWDYRDAQIDPPKEEEAHGDNLEVINPIFDTMKASIEIARQLCLKQGKYLCLFYI